MLELLGAEAELEQVRRAAQDASAGVRRGEVAVVAAQHARALVRGERDAARRALKQLVAGGAAHARRETTPVQKQDRLVARGEALLDRAVQRRAQHAVARRAAAVARQV